MEVWEIRLKKMPFDLGYWKQWEGQPVDSAFTLERCLQGDDHGAVFETQATGPDGRSLPATVRLHVAGGGETSGNPSVDDWLKRWNLAAGLSHPGLTPLLAFGETRLGKDADGDKLHCAFVVLPHPDETLVEVLADRPLTANETRETIQPVLKALLYLESKGLSPLEFTAANVMAFGDQVKISSDNLRAAPTSGGEAERLQAGAELLRALGRLLDQMLRGNGGGDSALPSPFAEIIRNCERVDAAGTSSGSTRWTLAMVEARLRGETPPPPNKKKPVVAPPAHAETRGRQPQPPPKPRPRRPSMLLWGIGITSALVIAVVLMNTPPSNPPPPGSINKEDPAAVPGAAPPPPQQPPSESTATKREPVAARNPATSTKPSPTGRRPETPPPAPATASPAPVTTTTSLEGVTQVLPEIPQKARNTITGRVRINVRVHVDSNGNVTQARQDPPMGSQYFATRAITAAQSWKFPPGSAASQEWLIRFELGRDQTRASAAKISP
jgi:eukaryotic-like serine/threonine-protein kinase